MGRGRSGLVYNKGTAVQQNVSAPQPATPTVDARGFRDTDDADFHDLYNGAQYYNRQNLTSA